MRNLLCLVLGSVLLASAGMAADEKTEKPKQNQRQSQSMSEDMRQAVEFERAKDRADARQAAIEAKHPTVFYNNQSGNSTDQNSANRVIDQGPAVKK